MKILSLNVDSSRGGAAIFASDLHRALDAQGIDANLLVQRISAQLPKVLGLNNSLLGSLQVHLAMYTDLSPVLLYPRWNREPFYSGMVPDAIPAFVRKQNPDLVHIHVINRGMVRSEHLVKISTPIIWTLHDLWPFTGGCHNPQSVGCQGFRDQCGRCPALGSGQEQDLSRRNWLRKRQAYRNQHIVFVAPSSWMAQQARVSSLADGREIRMIPNGIDLDTFRPMDQREARCQLALPPGKKYLLFGANYYYRDRNKGYGHIVPLLDSLRGTDVELLVFGSDRMPGELGARPVHNFGYVADRRRMAMLYAAADVTVIPSRQEAFCLVAAESMACGTPVVAFDTSGIRDIVDHRVNGYLAQYLDVADMAAGIKWLLGNAGRWLRLHRAATEKTREHFGIHAAAARYLMLYQELCQERTISAV